MGGWGLIDVLSCLGVGDRVYAWFCLLKYIYMSMWFLLSSLYSAMSLTCAGEWCFMRIMY